MTLLSPLALLFGLAAIVPLILHLYQRRQRVAMLFSTNRFFTQSVIRSQRRLRLRRLLLLVLRVAACVLFALALARPILGLAGLAGGSQGRRDIVVLLDDSLSMQATSSHPASSGRVLTQFDHAKFLAANVLKGLVAGDRAAVLTFTGRALARDTRSGLELSSDIAGLAEQAQQLSPTLAAGDASVALKRTAELLKGAGQRSRSLLVISDLQSSDWPADDWPEPDTPTRAVIARVAPPTRDNLLVDGAVLSQSTAIVGQPNLLRVRLVNHRQAGTTSQLVVDVDGKEVARRPVDLPGEAPHIERIPIVFDKPGEHALRVRLDSHDALPADDVFYTTAFASPRLPVLLVDGDVETKQEKSAAFYLQAGLASVNSNPEAETLPVRVIQPAGLPAEPLDNYRVVILSNVANLPVAQVERLEQFVRAGGGLAILLGDRADQKFYNEVLGAPTRPAGGLMPARIRSRLGVQGAAQPMHIVEAQLDHPVLQRFQGTLRSALAGISIYQAHGLTTREGWVLAAIDGRMPLIVERSYGTGRVILLATAPKLSWTDWPVRRAFIPLVGSLVSYLAGSGSPTVDHMAGQDLVLDSGALNVEGMKVLRPDGSTVAALMQATGSAPTAYLPAVMVAHVGFYRVASSKDSTAEGLWAVNAPRRESSPEVLNVEEAAKRAGRWQLTVLDATDQMEDGSDRTPVSLLSALSTAPGSTGIWNTLLWAVLAIVCLEPLIANRNPASKEQHGSLQVRGSQRDMVESS